VVWTIGLLPSDEQTAIFNHHFVIKMFGWLDIDIDDIDLRQPLSLLLKQAIYILKIYIQSSEHLYYKMLIENG